MENDVLTRINDIMQYSETFINDICIRFKGAEIVFLAQYIERLEEKEQMLNALLYRDNNIVVNSSVNNFGGKE